MSVSTISGLVQPPSKLSVKRKKCFGEYLSTDSSSDRARFYARLSCQLQTSVPGFSPEERERTLGASSSCKAYRNTMVSGTILMQSNTPVAQLYLVNKLTHSAKFSIAIKFARYKGLVKTILVLVMQIKTTMNVMIITTTVMMLTITDINRKWTLYILGPWGPFLESPDN